MKNEDLYSGLTYNEKCQMDVMRISELKSEDLLHFLNAEEFENSIEGKYSGIELTMKMASGETSTYNGGEYEKLSPKDLLIGEKPTIFDMDNLFSLDEDEVITEADE